MNCPGARIACRSDQAAGAARIFMDSPKESPEFRFYYFTSRYEQTVRFYRDILRLEVRSTWDRPGGERGTVFRSPNGVGLIEIEAGDRMPSLAGGFYVEVADLQEWRDRLRQSGVPLERDIGLTSYGHLNFKVVDPSGIELGFFQHAEPGAAPDDSGER